MKSRRVRVSHLLLALSAVPLVAGGARLVQLAALRAIVERRYRAHGAWMLRTYALSLGAGTQSSCSYRLNCFLQGRFMGDLETSSWLQRGASTLSCPSYSSSECPVPTPA